MTPAASPGSACAAIDLTDRRRAERERDHLLDSERAARADAERAGRMKDEFLATLSHELRTPLNAMLGWAQVLQHHATDARVHRGLQVIERNVRVQSQLIDDLLDMSRILSGKVRLLLEPLELAPIVEAAAETLRPSAELKGIELACTRGPATSGLVRADPNRLQQIVLNLLSNAIKFTPTAGKVSVMWKPHMVNGASSSRTQAVGLIPSSSRTSSNGSGRPMRPARVVTAVSVWASPSRVISWRCTADVSRRTAKAWTAGRSSPSLSPSSKPWLPTSPPRRSAAAGMCTRSSSMAFACSWSTTMRTRGSWQSTS